MITSVAWSPNRLYPARCNAASRSASSGRSIAWTVWIRNGSMIVWDSMALLGGVL